MARESRNHVCLSVRDTGSGMDPETLAKAATPFFTTKEIGRGTGLGLSMVQGFLEQSGGGLILNSRPGEGTQADLWLPVHTGPATLASRDPGGHHRAEPVDCSLRVLAVDDDPLVLMSTAMMLEALGHTVIQTNSPESARQILSSSEPIDLIVTDQSMPRLTGLELIEAGRRCRPNLPAIVATGYSETVGQGKGDLIWLSKPFGEEDLARAIRQAVLEPA